MYALVKPHFSQFGETGICPGWGAISGDSPVPIPRPGPFSTPLFIKKKNLIHIKSWGRGGAGEGEDGERGSEGEAISYTVCMSHTTPDDMAPAPDHAAKILN